MSHDISDLPAPSRGALPGRGRLTGRRVLVVGAGTQPADDGAIGNGRAISTLCAREGASLALADRDNEALDATAALASAEGSTATVHLVDISDAEACSELVEQAVRSLGGLDGLVLNVGIGAGAGLDGTTIEQWDAVVGVNLRGNFAILRAASPLLESGASVVLIGSVAGMKPGTNIPAYDTTKAGLTALMRHGGAELARRRVRANMVVPGLIDTPLGRAARGAAESQAHLRVPLGREGTPWEVAEATVWLLSDESAYVTGHQLVIDGGLTSLT